VSDRLTYEETALVLSTVRLGPPLPVIFQLTRGAWSGCVLTAVTDTHNTFRERETLRLTRSYPFTEMPTYPELMVGVHFLAAQLWAHELCEQLTVGRSRCSRHWSYVRDPHPEDPDRRLR
jgi:hypothetical protein